MMQTITIVADDKIPFAMHDGLLHLQPSFFIVDRPKYFGQLHPHERHEKNSFTGVFYPIALQENHFQLWEFTLQQYCLFFLPCQRYGAAGLQQGMNDRDAPGCMPQSPIQWGHQNTFAMGRYPVDLIRLSVDEQSLLIFLEKQQQIIKLVVLKQSIISKKILYLLMLTLLNLMVLSCASLAKNKCGCPPKKGMIGY
jgi:hypothetical protein